MPETLEKKTAELKEIFSSCPTSEAKYQKIIELGRTLPPLDNRFKTPENQVVGCQSVMYLHAFLQEGRIFFQADSEALISRGLAALLVRAYSGEPPLTVLQNPPHFLSEAGIPQILSPGRSGGLFSLLARMKQEALRLMSISHYS